MTTPPIPPPPSYAPTAGLPTTWWVADEPDPLPEPEQHWDWSWLRLRYNGLCLGIALLPLGYEREALHACAVEQSPQAAFGLAFMILLVAIAMDRWRPSWRARTALWLAILSLATTPAALSGALHILTGVSL